MTWILRVQYVDESKPWKELGYTMTLADEVVERSGFDIREAYFKQMVKELDRKIEHENRSAKSVGCTEENLRKELGSSNH